MGYIAVPVDMLYLYSQCIQLDYDYINSERIWKLKKDKGLTMELMPDGMLESLRVAQKLEGV